MLIFGQDKEDVERILSGRRWDNFVIGTMLPAFHWRFVWAKLKGYRTIRRAVGTDVLKCRLCWWYRWQMKICNWFIDAHSFVSWELMWKFQKIFPNEKILTPPWPAEPEPYERKFNVLFYMPLQGFRPGIDMDWVYGWDIFRELKAKYPEWNWLYVNLKVPKNVLMECYFRTDVLFRPTRHDGAPRMVMEAKMIGVPVVWNPDKMSLEYAEKELLEIYKKWVIGQ